MRKSKSISVLAGAAALGAFALATSTARASTIQDYTLSAPNPAISGSTGPYESVHIDLSTNGHTATVTFTSLSNGGNTYLMGDGRSADLNVNGSYTLGAVSYTTLPGGGFNTPSFVSNTPGQVDGFGIFDLSINDFDGFTDAANSISFTLTGNWTDAAHVLVANSQGAVAAAHVFVCENTCTNSEGATATGYAANGGAINVPEPASLALFGSALAGFGFAIRRRRNLAA